MDNFSKKKKIIFFDKTDKINDYIFYLLIVFRRFYTIFLKLKFNKNQI